MLLTANSLPQQLNPFTCQFSCGFKHNNVVKYKLATYKTSNISKLQPDVQQSKKFA